MLSTHLNNNYRTVKVANDQNVITFGLIESSTIEYVNLLLLFVAFFGEVRELYGFSYIILMNWTFLNIRLNDAQLIDLVHLTV